MSTGESRSSLLASFSMTSSSLASVAAHSAAAPYHRNHNNGSGAAMMSTMAASTATATLKKKARRSSSSHTATHRSVLETGTAPPIVRDDDDDDDNNIESISGSTNLPTKRKKSPSSSSSSSKKAKPTPNQSAAAAAAVNATDAVLVVPGAHTKEIANPFKENQRMEVVFDVNDNNDDHDNDDIKNLPVTVDTTIASSAKVPALPLPSLSHNNHQNKTFVQLAHDAIVSLNDRSGSSQVAIAKYVLQANPNMQEAQRITFKNRLNHVLKTALKSQRFVKVRASYKINVEWNKQQKKKKAAAEAARKKKKMEAKQQQTNNGSRTLATATAIDGMINGSSTASAMTNCSSKVEDLQQPPKTPSELGAQVKREAQAKRKLEEERLRKERAERLRRRKFPMEDSKLHSEDKELGVKPPEDVKKAPQLPCFFAAAIPSADARRNIKLPSNLVTASKCDSADMGSRGLVPDLLTVYHFFRGDVHYYQQQQHDGNGETLVPEFSLHHLVFAVHEVLTGNAKRSKLIPPLLSHLFVTCLQILMPPLPPNEASDAKNDCGASTTNYSTGNTSNNSNTNSHDPIAAAHKQLRKDLSRLSVGLCPASWADVCFLYMDTMERYYTSSASNQNYFLPGLDVLPGLHIDSRYLLHVTDHTLEPMTPAKVNAGDGDDNDLPHGYLGYLGDARGTLARAHAKLLKQDPWNLTADELMALLRALVDDVLATSPEISEDIAQREELMSKLLKDKKAAENHYRKIRFAYEGPKRPPKKTTTTTTTTCGGGGDENGKEARAEEAGGLDNADSGEMVEKAEEEIKKQTKEWKPTASKKQFEAAQKALQKANDAYEKGVRNLVGRTEPVGYDRNHSAVYCFRHDPEVLYVEVMRPPTWVPDGIPDAFQTKRTSWHVIDTRSLFEQFVSSLDIRGKREHDLYENMVGLPGTQQSLRNSLFDDIKERSTASARRKEFVELKRRMENAKIKCDENRHSGRLAGRAVVELSQLEAEIQDLERQIKGNVEAKSIDFEELTGLELLRKFDTTERFKVRGSRSKKEAATVSPRPRMPCSILWPSGELDGTGIAGCIATQLVALEERCESLAPVEDQSARDEWITDLEDAVQGWNNYTTVVLGTSSKAPPASSDAPVVQFASDIAAASPSSSNKIEKSIVDHNKRRSFGSLGSMASYSEAKRRRVGSPSSSQVSISNILSISQIIALIKKPLLALEERVFNITGLAMAAADLDLADANMSDDENDDGHVSQAWKKPLHRIKSIQARRYVQVREAVVEAIDAARRAQLGGVVAQLRAALMLHRPNAGGACKSAALEVLANHGGYDPDDDDHDEEARENADTKKKEESEDTCLLAEEAVVMESSLDGNEYAGRSDWIEAVKSCKTVTRLASLSCAFVKRASDKLAKLETEKKALLHALAMWIKDEERRERNQNGKKKYNRQSDEKVLATTEVWANVRFTEEYCMIKLDADPWWPAKKCEPKDENLTKSLASVNRTLVSLLGEEGALRVVSNNNIKPFTGETMDEDLKGYSKEIRKQLSEAMAMGRRIWRGRERATATASAVGYTKR